MHEFRNPASNAVRDDLMAAMEAGPISTADALAIGRGRIPHFDGVITGIIGTLHKKGIIQSAGQGWWGLAGEVLGEVERIAPGTTKVGDEIVHNGVKYRQVEK